MEEVHDGAVKAVAVAFGVCFLLSNCTSNERDERGDSVAGRSHRNEPKGGTNSTIENRGRNSARGGFHPIGKATIRLVDRESSLFRIVNKSDKSIRLTSIYPKEAGGKFSPANVKYAVFRNNRWNYFADTANTVSYYYELKPGQAMTINLDLEYFEVFGVRAGELVRMGIDDIESLPFRL